MYYCKLLCLLECVLRDLDISSGDDWATFPELQPLPNEDVSVGFWLEPVMHEKAGFDHEN